MADKYIQYAYPVEDIIDNVMVWTSGAVNGAYFAYSTDGITWTYLAGVVDGVLTSYGTSPDNARTNKVSLASGKNQFFFPNGIAAKYCRMFLSGSFTVSVYELIFTRTVIAEQVIAANLAAINADLGNIIAGTLQSENWGASAGFFVDLGSEFIKIGGYTSPKLSYISGVLSIDGSVIVNGTITATKLNVTSLSAVTANTGALTVNGKLSVGSQIELGTNAYINTAGKTSYADTDAGIYLGYDAGAYKFNIGDDTYFMKWSGNQLLMSFNDVGLVAGDYVWGASVLESVTPISSYVKMQSFIIGRSGTCRVKFQLKGGSGVYYVYARVYINGIAVGVERRNNSSSYSGYFSEDFAVVNGDSVEIWAKAYDAYNPAYVQNFRICCAGNTLACCLDYFTPVAV